MSLGRTRVLAEVDNLCRFGRQYARNKSATVGLLILVFFCAIAVLAPLIAPYEPLRAGVGESFVPPNSQFPMGTDDLGRDVYSQVVHGARITLIVGVLSCILSAAIGLGIGCISGYYAGTIDDLLMRIADFFLTLPFFVLALVTVVLIGRSILNIVTVIGLVLWPSTARLVRADFLSLKEKEFVEAARALGYSNRSIIFAEILPNAISPAIVNTTLQMGTAILVETGLSFLGAGDINLISWGLIIRGGTSFLRTAPWITVFPSVMVVLTILSINLVGDGLNYALNPRRRLL